MIAQGAAKIMIRSPWGSREITIARQRLIGGPRGKDKREIERGMGQDALL